MNKKIFLPVIAVAILMPIIVFGMNSEDADKIGKEFAVNNPNVTMGVHSLEADISEQEEVNRAELIVEGTVIAVKPYWKIIHKDTMPKVYSEFTILVDDVIKGDKVKTVKVAMAGGTLDGVTTKTDATNLTKGTQVIMLLAKDPSSVFGDNYHPISISKSTYIIEDGMAKNKLDERTMNKTEVKSKLAKLANP